MSKGQKTVKVLGRRKLLGNTQNVLADVPIHVTTHISCLCFVKIFKIYRNVGEESLSLPGW